MLSDQEPRDHKEDIDSDVATWDGRQAGVERDHRQNGDGTQALDIRSKVGASTATIAPLWCRRVPGHGSYGPMLGLGQQDIVPAIPEVG